MITTKASAAARRSVTGAVSGWGSGDTTSGRECSARSSGSGFEIAAPGGEPQEPVGDDGSETAGHIPQEFLDAWRASGPDRALKEVAARFRELADEGLLDAPDPERAATHFLWLTAGEISDRIYHGALSMPDEERDELIVSGVRAFLRGYGRR